MKQFKWDKAKSELLKAGRGVSFEDISSARLITVLQHPVREHQKLMLFDYEGYIWVVPCIEEDNCYFLKTLFPSRKYTKLVKGDKK
jgi:hypothetical protein